MDVYDEDREFGPVFNASHFLLPVLRLQKAIEAIVAEDGTTFQDVCNAPLSPQSKICNVQSLWAYWQVSHARTVKPDRQTGDMSISGYGSILKSGPQVVA